MIVSFKLPAALSLAVVPDLAPIVLLLEDTLAEGILNGEIKENQTTIIDAKDERVIIK